jgi:pimeloyl-ACP methyl ester carboxylesterase
MSRHQPLLRVGLNGWLLRLDNLQVDASGRSAKRLILSALRSSKPHWTMSATGLAGPHVVAPDIGTSASLFAAAAHPGRFLSVVVGSGGAAVPVQLGGELRDWVFAPDLEPYRRLGGRTIVGRVIQTLERYELSDAAREDYLASFEGDRFGESMRYVQSCLRV